VGCGKTEEVKTEEAAATTEEVKAEEPAAETATETDEPIYIPVISKGFQHQFWQAVKKGAMQAALDYGVEITFEGPETEAQVDKQIEMLEAALSKIQQLFV